LLLVANAADLKARIGAKAGLTAKPTISGPVLENYQPTWGDRIAQYMGSLMGNSNAGVADSTKFWREKINPITPIIGAQEAYKTGKAKIASGDVQEGIMDMMGQASGPEEAIFIGPAARSWSKSAAKEAKLMLKAKADPEEIWRRTRTAFAPASEAPEDWFPFQEVSSRNMVIDPDLATKIPKTRAGAKPVEEFMEHPMFSEYKGSGKIPFWSDQKSGNAGGLYTAPFGPPRSLKSITSMALNPDTLGASTLFRGKPTGLIGVDLHPDLMFPEQVAEHEFQHGVQHLEGWPTSIWSHPEANRGMMQPGTPEWNLLDALEGQYGKDRYPGMPKPKRRSYGLYEHSADETMARNAESRMFLTDDERGVYPPHMTQDIPYNKQILPNLVRERQDALLLNALVGLKP
jgi:hypothetical protein